MHIIKICLPTVAAFGVTLSILFSPDAVFACGGIFDVKCNLENGGLSPENLGKQGRKAAGDASNVVRKAGQDVADALNELQASTLSGPALEQAIRASYSTAINSAMPMPSDIRRQLTGYSSTDSMDRVRYKVGDNGFLNLAHLLEQGGFADAVTLDNLVIFKGPSEASDPSIWAHELVHVDQYRDWGIHSFAVQYARNHNSVEDPAYVKGEAYWNWHEQQLPSGRTRRGDQRSNSGGWSDNGSAGAFLGLQTGVGMKPCGCWGPNPNPVESEPRCASGAVRVAVCSGFCAPGHPVYGYVCE